jgi:S-adenosylmethionine/arginine decarboxylase-like enzyme
MGKKIEHNHLLINAKIKKYPTNTTKVKDFLTYLIEQIDMKIISGPHAVYVNKTGNRGMTASVMIETSHVAFHVWDEQDPALLQFDLYTCSTLDHEKVLKELDRFFEFKSYEYQLFDREKSFELKESNRV